jgi:anthranilate phosphoribosyltransferase
MKDSILPHSLEDLLKKKGIGPEGSKSLKKEELELMNTHFRSSGISLTTKATMLTALLLLDPNEAEKEWIEKVKQDPDAILPSELLPFIKEAPESTFLNFIQKLIRKQSLTDQESTACMNYLFDPSVPEYLKGPFLEGERLKRETFSENETFFNFLWNKTSRIQTSLPLLIDICDSYDGCTRTHNYTAFIAALLASVGFPTYLHALKKVAPKEGITSHQVLKQAGKNPVKNLMDAANDISNTAIGWGYVDQQVYFPELHALKKMRKEMVKRPFLATFEKLLQPIRSKKGNLIVTGYTHPHYRTELVNQLARQNECLQALVLKGAEGSTQLSMAKNTLGVYYDGKQVQEINFHPTQFGLQPTENRINKSITPTDVVREGLAALQGEKNEARLNMMYTSMIILQSFGLMAKEASFELLTASLDSGKALQHWNRGCK